jgi:hypothetical protein
MKDDVTTETVRAIEAIVLVAHEPVPTDLIAQLLEIPALTVDEVCGRLAATYEEAGHGLLVAGAFKPTQILHRMWSVLFSMVNAHVYPERHLRPLPSLRTSNQYRVCRLHRFAVLTQTQCYALCMAEHTWLRYPEITARGKQCCGVLRNCF